MLAQLRRNGQIAVFFESYAVKKLFRTQWNDILNHCNQHGIKITGGVYDKAAAALEKELKQIGISDLWRSPNNVEESLKVLSNNVAADHNGFRHIIVAPECRLLRLEFSSYVLGADGRPLKYNDHGIDALRYLAWSYFIRDMRPVELAAPASVAEYADETRQIIAGIWEQYFNNAMSPIEELDEV